MDDNMMEHQIADYMVKHGTKNTNFGPQVFEIFVFTFKFNITENWIQ